MLLQQLMMTTDEKDQGTAALNSPEFSACPPAAHDLWVTGLISVQRGEDIMLCFDAQNSQKQKAHTPQTKRDLLVLLFYILEVARLGEFKGWHCSTFILWKNQGHTGEVIYTSLHNYFILKPMERPVF